MKTSASPDLPDLRLLSTETKISLLSGTDFWRTREIPALGIASVKLSDGPNGVRGDLSGSVPATCFPVGVCLGASWNTKLLGEVARVIADEAREKCAHVVLGPTVNLQRTPIGGRNFECYSEDPYLTGMLGTAFVSSLQAEGIGACPKHFIANDTEFERHTISSVVDERTLAAVYLLPFEMIVRKADPWMIMSSYNRLNGIYTSSHEDLLIRTLKEEWKFGGVVVSDWGAALETIPNAIGGLDLEMPGPSKVWGTKLRAAVDAGEVSEACIDSKVARLLKLIQRTGARPGDARRPERGEDTPAKRELVRRAATEGMVLLRNAGNLLPLEPGFSGRIAVIGPNAARGQIMGGGSSFVHSHPPVHPLEGIRFAFPNAVINYQPGCRNNRYAPLIHPGQIRHPSGEGQGFRRQVFSAPGFGGEPDRVDVLPTSVMKLLDAFGAERPGPAGIVLEGDFAPEFSGSHTLGLMSAGRSRLYVDGEEVIDNWTAWRRGQSFYTFGSDEIRKQIMFEAARPYRIRVEYERPAAALIAGLQFGIEPPLSGAAIQEAADLAAEADITILLLGSNPDWETEGHDRTNFGLPGDQDRLAEAVLSACPATIVVMNVGSATEMPWLERTGAVLVPWFGGQEMGNALGDVLSGKSDPGGRLPFTWPKRVADHPAMATYPGSDGEMAYVEGVYMGYRGFLSHGVEPLAPFGFGLSYGQADIVSAAIQDPGAGPHLEIRVIAANRSDVTATLVVQAYAELTPAPGAAPIRALVGFTKVELGPYEHRKVDLQADLTPLARLIEPGSRTLLPSEILIGESAAGPFLTVVRP